MLALQVLDLLQLADVALRKTAAVGGGALGNDQAQMLVHHQRSGMCLQNLRSNADRVDRLVEREAPIGRGAARYSFYPSSNPFDRPVRAVRALFRDLCAPDPQPRPAR